MARPVKLYLVIPCYNEIEVLRETEQRLDDKLSRMISAGLITEDSRMVFVDDGSYDGTWELIEELYSENIRVRGIKSSRNRGHQNALLCGLMTVKDECDVTISMDADLQDDIEVLDQFIEKYNEGCEIVYGVRNSRKTDSFFKRFTAQAFYRFMHLMGTEVVYNHADYRLLSRRALKELKNYKEVNLFLRGLVPLVGFQTGVVEYERGKRYAGKSKYKLGSMIRFAEDGITSMSVRPIRLIAALGVCIFFISILFLIWMIVGALKGHTIRGWASTMVSIWALGGLQLFAIGIIGEYIGKVYLESKHRPRYIVEKYLRDRDSEGRVINRDSERPARRIRG